MFEELEGAKLKIISACEKLLKADAISESDFDALLEILENIETIHPDQLRTSLGKIAGPAFDVVGWDDE